MDIDLVSALPRIAMFFPVFLFSLCFHEYAHGWMAKRLGDDTAEQMGRLSMNPVVHADILGTIVLPLFSLLSGYALFGWAKPVPVNPRNFKSPEKDMFWVAFAGPLSNVLLAILGAFILVIGLGFVAPGSGQKNFHQFFNQFIFFNILLALFNMIPLHPLDGGKVIQRFIPRSWNRALEENQNILQMVLIGFLIMGGFRYLAGPIMAMQRTLIIGVATLFS